MTNQLEEELGQANITLGPATYSQAMKSEDVDKWIDAMHEEKSSLESQSVWEVHDITDLPKERKAIGSRWVYTVKLLEDGSIERYKACRVVKGFSQISEIDFSKTFIQVT